MLIDIEVLYYLRRGESPIHRHAHTYVVACVLGLTAGVLAYFGLRVLAHVLPSRLRWVRETRTASRRSQFADSLLAGFVGAVSHIFLDSCMHGDMNPFWPFAEGNSCMGIISLKWLHLLLVLSGVFGVILWLFMRETSASK